MTSSSNIGHHSPSSASPSLIQPDSQKPLNSSSNQETLGLARRLANSLVRPDENITASASRLLVNASTLTMQGFALIGGSLGYLGAMALRGDTAKSSRAGSLLGGTFGAVVTVVPLIGLITTAAFYAIKGVRKDPKSASDKLDNPVDFLNTTWKNACAITDACFPKSDQPVSVGSNQRPASVGSIQEIVPRVPLPTIEGGSAIGQTYEGPREANCDFVFSRNGFHINFDGMGHNSARNAAREQPIYQSLAENLAHLHETSSPTTEAAIPGYRTQVATTFKSAATQITQALQEEETERLKADNDYWNEHQDSILGIKKRDDLEIAPLTEEVFLRLAEIGTKTGKMEVMYTHIRNNLDSMPPDERSIAEGYLSLMKAVLDRDFNAFQRLVQEHHANKQEAALNLQTLKDDANEKRRFPELFKASGLEHYSAVEAGFSRYFKPPAPLVGGPAVAMGQLLHMENGQYKLLTAQFADCCFLRIRPTTQQNEEDYTFTRQSRENMGGLYDYDKKIGTEVKVETSDVVPGEFIMGFSDGIGEFLTDREIMDVIRQNPNATPEELKNAFIEKIKSTAERVIDNGMVQASTGDLDILYRGESKQENLVRNYNPSSDSGVDDISLWTMRVPA